MSAYSDQAGSAGNRQGAPPRTEGRDGGLMYRCESERGPGAESPRQRRLGNARVIKSRFAQTHRRRHVAKWKTGNKKASLRSEEAAILGDIVDGYRLSIPIDRAGVSTLAARGQAAVASSGLFPRLLLIRGNNLSKNNVEAYL